MAAAIASVLPTLSEGCGREVAVVGTGPGIAAVRGRVTWLAGCRTRNRATDVGR